MKASKFLKLVSKEPALWDVDHPEYKDIELKHSKWKEIASEFLISYKEAMSRFKSMRDKYRREKRLIQERPDIEREKWELMEHLTFLDNVRPRNPRSTHLEDIPPAPINRPVQTAPPTLSSPTSGHATRLSTGSLRQPSYVELPMPALVQRPTPEPTRKVQQPHAPAQVTSPVNVPPPILKPAPLKKLQYETKPMYVKPESAGVKATARATPPAMSQAPLSKVRKVSLGGFIDQMVDQEPEVYREKFSLEILDAVVKIKRQFIDERQNH